MRRELWRVSCPFFELASPFASSLTLSLFLSQSTLATLSRSTPFLKRTSGLTFRRLWAR